MFCPLLLEDWRARLQPANSPFHFCQPARCVTKSEGRTENRVGADARRLDKYTFSAKYRDGRLFLFWAQHRNSIKLEERCSKTTQRDAAQPGRKKPLRISEAVLITRPLVPSPDEWRLPISLWGGSGWSVGENSPRLVISTHLNSNNTAQVVYNTPKDTTEAGKRQFVERADGSLWFLMRTRPRAFSSAVSFQETGYASNTAPSRRARVACISPPTSPETTARLGAAYSRLMKVGSLTLGNQP